MALSVSGVALVMMLILFLLGLREGVFQGASAYMENAPGSVVVLPPGVRSTFTGSGQSIAPDTAKAVAERLDGSASVVPILMMVAIPELHGRKEAIRLVGYDAALGGGAWDLAAGREPASDDEVVLDRVLAKRHDFKLGDSFEIQGRQVKVVGLSKGTSSFSYHRTVDESKRLNEWGPRIIISSSGMLTGGRVLHHLRRLLPDPKNLLVLVGYQAVGTRGRALQDGAKLLKMHGGYIPVRAQFISLETFRPRGSK